MHDETHHDLSKGHTMYEEHSQWGKNQHFILVRYIVPGQKYRPALGKIFLALDEDRKATYSVKDFDGNDIIPPTKNLIEIKKYLNEHGRELAEKQLARSKEQTREREEEALAMNDIPEGDFPEEPPFEENDKEQEIDEMREKKTRRDKNIER